MNHSQKDNMHLELKVTMLPQWLLTFFFFLPYRDLDIAKILWRLKEFFKAELHLTIELYIAILETQSRYFLCNRDRGKGPIYLNGGKIGISLASFAQIMPKTIRKAIALFTLKAGVTILHL